MANYDCSACEDLRENAPNLVVNGMTSTECTYLKNNTGLSGSSDDCTDLDDLNDCLVGNMADEVSAYDVCDWKTFMKSFIPNTWTVLKGVICSICGIWNNIDKLWCWVENLAKPQANSTLYPDDSKVKFRKVDGVALRYDASNPKPSDAPLQITVIGSVARITGSITCSGNMPSSYTSGGSTGRVDWKDVYDGGTTITNTAGNSSYKGNFPSGGVLMYEYEVKACDWGFSALYNSPLMPGNAGNFIARIQTYQSGEEYPYDYGWDANGKGQTYTPSSSSYDTLIQVRMMNVETWGIAKNTGNITPNGVAMVRPCTDSWEC